MAKNTKRKDPMIMLVIALVLFVALAVGAFLWSNQITADNQKELQKLQTEINARNQQRVDQYEQDVAEYNARVTANQPNEAWPEAAQEGWDVIDLTNYPLEVPGTVTISRADAMFGGLLLVNEWHSRPEDFDESAIVPLYTYAKDSGLSSFWQNATCKLHPVAIDALIEALKDAKAIGYDNYVVEAGYNFRSYEDQNERFQKEVDKYRQRYPNYTEQQLIDRAKKNVNYPGTSEFNTGLSFCLYLYDGSDYYKDTPFFETEDGKWFLENSWKYGFVFRFPVQGYPTEDTVSKTYKTGIGIKLKCFRYVGKGNAAVMNHLDLCLEEYIEYLREHPHIAVFENGVKRYEITYQTVGDDAATFTVDINRLTNNYTMSLDNMDGVITVYEY
ncbi:MAG: D-alanyl-D-alanine carboxypeptidase family protein [Aristaeellaceae bacterium]